MQQILVTLILVLVIACGVKYCMQQQQQRQSQNNVCKHCQRQYYNSYDDDHRHRDVYHDTDLTPDEMETIRTIREECKKMSMVPIFNPFFNARRIILELLLLQQHLEEPGMLCKECIGRKHMLTVEAYALEAIGLVKSERAHLPEYQQLIKDMEDVAKVMRNVHKLFMEASAFPPETPGRAEVIAKIARAIRALRKELSQRYAEMPSGN